MCFSKKDPDSQEEKKSNSKITQDIVKWSNEEKSEVKLLLLGTGSSGKSSK